MSDKTLAYRVRHFPDGIEPDDLAQGETSIKGPVLFSAPGHIGGRGADGLDLSLDEALAAWLAGGFAILERLPPGFRSSLLRAVLAQAAGLGGAAPPAAPRVTAETILGLLREEDEAVYRRVAAKLTAS